MSGDARIPVAVIGASGNVGRKIVSLLIERNIVAPDQLILCASKQSAGTEIKINSHQWQLHDVDYLNFANIKLALFATDSDVSKKYIAKALKAGAVVVDSSSLYRLDADVPLIVYPVNKHLVSIRSHQLYAIANCVASPIASVIAPLHRKHKIKRVVASTYQSVSGAGKRAMDELGLQLKSIVANEKCVSNEFSRQIAMNVIPQIGAVMEDGFTHEEFKIMREIQKIVGGNFKVTTTSVRVPVMVGHSVSLGIEFEKNIGLNEVVAILQSTPSVKISESYMTPIEVVGSDDVYVGRIRKDPSAENAIQMWLCSDNLRRGAATDMVEVVEELVKQIKGKVE